MQCDPICGTALGLGHVHALRLQHRERAAVGRPQQQREQERRRYGFVGGDARIGGAQAFEQHPS